MKTLVLAAAAAALLVGGAAHAGSIDIPTDGGQITLWGPDAVGDQSYGQVFTAPQAALLDYSLTVDGAAFSFVSQVYAWDGSGVTGAALYTSGVNVNQPTMTTYTYSPGIALTVGQAYIALVTPDPGGVNIGGSGTGAMASNSSPGPSGFFYAEGDPGVHDHWFAYCCNAEFHADFADGVGGAVPEPASWALLIAGFGGVGAALRRRRTTAELSQA